MRRLFLIFLVLFCNIVYFQPLQLTSSKTLAAELSQSEKYFWNFWQVGDRYFSLGDYETSIVFYKNAEYYINNSNLSLSVVNGLYYNMASAYYNLTDYKNCRKYALMAYKNGINTVSILEFIADSSFNLRQWEEAMNYYKIALIELLKIKNKTSDKKQNLWISEKERKFRDMLSGDYN